MQGHGGLSFEAPSDAEDGSFDEYLSDPAHPVEYIDQIEIGMTGDYMIQDQRVASRRPDVLVYEGPALSEELTIAGPIEARLFVSTTGTDSDWIVKLIDVYPDDYRAKETDSPAVKLGGYPAARPRRRDARQVPQQPREAGAVRPRAADARQLHACRTSPTRSAPATRSWSRSRAPGSR